MDNVNPLRNRTPQPILVADLELDPGRLLPHLSTRDVIGYLVKRGIITPAMLLEVLKELDSPDPEAAD